VNHFQLAFRNLSRRPMRSLLTMMGVALAVGSFITLYGLSDSVHENVQQSFDEQGADLTARRSGVAEPFGGTINENLMPKVAAVPGVAAVSGQLITFAATDNNDTVLAAGWAPDSFYWQHVPLIEGRLPELGDAKEAVVGNEIAMTLGKKVGDDIALLGEKFRIVGISNYTSIINRNRVLVNLAPLQEITFRKGAITFLSMELDKPNDEGEVNRVIETIEAMGGLAVTKSEGMMKNDSMIGLLSAVSSSMAWVALLMGVLMVLNTLLMAVLERMREIGILSALGWSKQRIMGALVIEGFLLSAVGSAIGILIGVLGSMALSAAPAIGRYVAVSPTLGLIAATAVAAIVLGILGSFYPAWVATRASPAAALERA
jgi:putative ABC transport system permease protein